MQPATARTDLLRQGATLRGPGGAKRVVLRASWLAPGRSARVRLKGRIVASLGARRAPLTRLTMQVGRRSTTISAGLGKRRLPLFSARGRAKISGGGVSLSGATLALTPVAARLLAHRLGLATVRPGRLGQLGLNVNSRPPAKTRKVDTQPAPTPAGPTAPAPTTADPCDLAISSEAAPSFPPAPTPPDLPGATPISGGSVDWGLRASLRNYVGSGGAIVVGPPAAQLPSDGSARVGPFHFPLSSGEVLPADPAADADAVLQGSGTVAFCYAAHSFKYLVADPAVVLDGDGGDSYLSASVETIMYGVRTAPARVRLADLDLAAATVSPSPEGLWRWAGLPATLTAAGAEALCGAPSSNPCTYTAGTDLDPLTVEATAPGS